jgi:hypothetical protein
LQVAGARRGQRKKGGTPLSAIKPMAAPRLFAFDKMAKSRFVKVIISKKSKRLQLSQFHILRCLTASSALRPSGGSRRAN